MWIVTIMHEKESFTVNERSSECYMDIDLALWLQVHLQTQTHNCISAYTITIHLNPTLPPKIHI